MFNSRLDFGKNKDSKILFSLILSIMLVGLASAQDDSPGPGSDTAAQEFQLEGQSWNNIAVNVDSISLSEADGDCSFDYEPYSAGGVSGYAWTVNPETGNWEALGTDGELSTTKGYSIWVPESCSLVLEGNTASEVYERDLAGQSWNLITLPEGRSPSDLEDRIENTDGVSIGDWQGEKYWTNMGGEWDHPYNSLDNDRPFYVWVNSETTVDFGESVEDPGPGGDPDDGSDDSDDSDDGVDESPSDCAEDEYYDHGFNMCLPDSDSGDDGDDGSDDSGDRSNEELGDLSMEIRPSPTDWTDDSNDRVSCEEVTETVGGGPYRERVTYDQCDVDAEFAATAGEGYIDGFRVEAAVQRPGVLTNVNPSYTCEGPDWTTCHTSSSIEVDSREIDDYSAWIEVQEESCRYAGRHQGERCSWDSMDREEFNNFE